MTQYIEVEQGTPEWREARVGKITASAVAAILGCSPFKNRAQLLREMVQEANGIFSTFASPAMRWGNDHEDEAAAQYEVLHATEKVSKAGFFVKGDLGASPDRLVGDNGLLEIKCPYSLREDATPAFKSVHEQLHYWHQCQLQMYVIDKDWVDFMQWTPNDYKLERVERDPMWFENHADDFVQFMEDYAQALDDAEHGGPAEMLAMSKDWLSWAEEYKRLKALADEAKRIADEAKNALVELARSADVERCEGAGLIVQRTVSKGSVDYKAIVNELSPSNKSELEEKFRKPGSASWRVNVSKGESK